MERDEIIGYIQATFEDYEIEFEDDEEDQTYIKVNIWNEDETCAYIEFTIVTIDNNLIIINNIANCGDNGIGSVMMDLIDQLALAINSKEIELIEKSKIIMKTKKSTMQISLSLLNTLKSGQSWYNSKGYICKTLSPTQHIERVEKNTNFIQSTLMYEIGVDPNLLSKIHSKNEMLDPHINVQTYFTIVANILKDWKHCKYFKSLVKLINIVDELKVVEVECVRDAMIKRLTVAATVNKKYKKQYTKKLNSERKQSRRKTKNKKT
jgi:hypothetical protein